jgi:hypothetical protein
MNNENLINNIRTRLMRIIGFVVSRKNVSKDNVERTMMILIIRDKILRNLLCKAFGDFLAYLI